MGWNFPIKNLLEDPGESYFRLSLKMLPCIPSLPWFFNCNRWVNLLNFYRIVILMTDNQVKGLLRTWGSIIQTLLTQWRHPLSWFDKRYKITFLYLMPWEFIIFKDISCVFDESSWKIMLVEVLIFCHEQWLNILCIYSLNFVPYFK